MKFARSTPVPIDPEVRRVALKAAEYLRVAASLDDAAQLIGNSQRRDEGTRLAEQVLALRDEYRQRATDAVKTYTTKGATHEEVAAV